MLRKESMQVQHDLDLLDTYAEPDITLPRTQRTDDGRDINLEDQNMTKYVWHKNCIGYMVPVHIV